MNLLRFLTYTGVTLAIWVGSGTPAYGVPFFKPDLPDFYQHQKSGPTVNVPMDSDIRFTPPDPKPATVPSYDTTTQWWEKDGGWCCVTAFVNSFYYVEKHFGYDGFFTRTGGETKTWQEQMIFAVEDFAERFFFGPDDIPEYVRRLEGESKTKIQGKGGTPKPRLTYSEFTLDSGKVMKQEDDGKGTLLPAVDASSTFSSLFDVYHDELCRSEDVTVRLVGPTDTSIWWSGSFHVVTGAGVEDCKDKTKRKIWFADPDKRNGLTAGAYDATDVREPYPTDPIPIPVGEMHYEMVTMDASGEIIDGLYKGAHIAKITAISPVPEPGTLIVVGFGLASVVAVARTRRVG